MTPEEYEEKRKNRYLRLVAASERAERESQSSYALSDKMSSVIPMGQPILVGHYSEAADRRYRERIHQKMRKGRYLHEKAVTLQQRAEAALSNNAIFSDDPQAGEKIETRIDILEKRQALMREANKLVRKNDRAGLSVLGFSDTRIDRLFTPDFCGRVGYADYELSNNSANIRRLKLRLASLNSHANDVTSELVVGDIRIVENTDINRLQIFFPGKPSEEVRHALKSRGFHWSPSEKAWQRQRSNGATYWAKEIVKAI